MKIYLLTRISDADYEEFRGFVIRADSGRIARQIAAKKDRHYDSTIRDYAPDERWLSAEFAKLTTLASGNSVSQKPGVILSDNTGS